MAKLSVSNNQKDQILGATALLAVGTHLDDALKEGVSAPADNNLLALLTGYASLAVGDQSKVKDVFRRVLAAFIKVMNFDQVGIGTVAAPIVITVAKPSSGTITLTIIGGLIVSKTEA